jgi:hypothetical protein
MTAATYVIKQFDIVSVGKFFAVFGLVWGFFTGLFVAAGAGTMGYAMGLHGFSLLGGLVALVLMIIIGGVIGFIGGAVVAIIYNVVLGATGGLEMEMEVKEKSG